VRIGIDARTACGRYTGDRSYTLGLIHGLAAISSGHEFVLYLDGPPPLGLPSGPQWQVRVLRAPVPRLWTPVVLPRAARADGVEVLHVQYIAPACRRPVVVTTVHDVTFRLHPEWFTVKDRLLLDWGMRRSLRTVGAVLAVSEWTRRDLLRVYGLAADRVCVTPNALPPTFALPEPSEVGAVRGKYGLEEPYVLFVGVLQPRKNLPRMIGGFLAAKRRHGLPHAFVIAGKEGWKCGPIFEALKATEAGDDVRLIGYVPDEDLPGLFAGADVFLFATLYEGFGIPVLEAFASGTAVITSNTSALPEVAGEAAVLVDPCNESEIAEAVGRVLTDEGLRRHLVEAGGERLKAFSWERTAELTVACYERAAGRSSAS